MNTIFVGGSRHISRLPAEVKKRLENIVACGHQVIVGDANGADKAVQRYLHDIQYDKVAVFCSGEAPRNNLGTWRIHRVDPPKNVKGFQFYAAKDREMAHEADFGLMIWDGKSPGTVLNVLRLVQAGKISVIFNVSNKTAINIKSIDQWRAFFSQCSPTLQTDVRARATLEEWASVAADAHSSLVGSLVTSSGEALSKSLTPSKAVTVLNQALASGDAVKTAEVLGVIARDRGMTQVSRETGLARESLYRALDTGGNPEFATIMKVLFSIGLRFEAKTIEPCQGHVSAKADNVGR